MATKNVLVTGGTGFIGSELIKELSSQGYNVAILSRSHHRRTGIKVFTWDLEKGIIDLEALRFADCIVHLAGENVGAGRWSSKRKKEILASRTAPIALMKRALLDNDITIDSFICASGIGYYGDAGAELLDESNTVSKRDFLSDVCVEWEKGAQSLSGLCRVVSVRVGFVLDAKSEAFNKLLMPIKLGVGSPLGSGKQFISWIHLKDLVSVFMKTIQDETLCGVFNGCSPNPVTQKELTVALATTYKKPLWMPNVPKFALQLLLGEMADLVTAGCRAIPQRLLEGSFEFSFPKIAGALKQIKDARD